MTSNRPWLRMAAAAILLGCATAQAGEPSPQAVAGPIATVRVSFNRNGITEAKASGFADVAAQRAVTADDPVRIASISKLVVAIGVLRLVEQGKLDLDADVSQLLGWKLRHPGFPGVPITLRLLLSHRSSLTDKAGYWQVKLGENLQDLLQDPRAWDMEHAPGTFWRYTNLNFPLVASVMERATGERFDHLMDQLVLRPLGLSACYNWALCDTATAARAVVLYDQGKPVRDDHHGAKPDCAVTRSAEGSCDLSLWRAGANGALFSPQGGLRISMRGLSKIGRLLLGEGMVDGVRLLKPESMRMMTTPLWSYAPGTGLTYEEDEHETPPEKGYTCRYGLAVQTLATPHPFCGDDPFGDGVARFGHSGGAYGLIAGLWVDPASGTGVAYFATDTDSTPPGRHSVFKAIAEDLATGRAPSR